MADTRTAKLRRLWLNVHLWIGVGLAVLLIPISLSGGLLVWHDDIDAWLNPQRYAVTGAQVALPPSAYLAKAAEAVAKQAGDLRPAALRYPEPGLPVRVITRVQQSRRRRTAAYRYGISRSADRRGARRARFPRLILRLLARLPREPDDCRNTADGRSSAGPASAC